jgi:hypothetical protein
LSRWRSLTTAVQLTDEQQQQVRAWIAEGLKLSDVQQRLAEQFDIRLTYMEARFLIDDLKLTPAETAPPAAPAATASVAASSPLVAPDAPAAAPAGGVAVKVDEIARPGAIVSGSVTFSDGGKAQWHLDQYGRLGMVPATEGYRPPQEDVPEFQAALDRELQRLGF